MDDSEMGRGQLGGAMHLFTGATNVSLKHSTINVVGQNMAQNAIHVQGNDHVDTIVYAALEQKVADWLSPINFRAIQYDTLSKRTPGTGEWFLKSQTFLTWLSMETDVLWIIGIPGAGKTILTSIMIDYLQNIFLEKQGIAVLFAYFRYTDQYSTGDVLAALIKQLVELCPSLPPGVESMYAKYSKIKSRLSEQELSDLFRLFSPCFTKVYVVLDALDEISDKTRSKLLRILSSFRVNLFITSRPLDLSLGPAWNPTVVEIQDQTEQDIETFVTTSIQENPYLSRILRGDDSLLTETCAKLKERSKGMFLAASLHIEALNGCTTRNELRNTAKTLPSDINDMYLSTLQRVEAQKEQYASLATRAIIWLTHACRSLRIAELQHALAISCEMESFDEDDITPEELIVSACCGLIVVDESSRIVRLAHYTAREFFQRTKSGLFSTPHSFITRSCIAYLSAFDLPETTIQTESELTTFLFQGLLLNYAYENWGLHARNCFSEGGLPNSVLNFFLRCSRYPFRLKGSKHLRRRIVSFAPCHIAAYHGLPEILEVMPESWNSSCSTFDDRTPLILASERGHEKVVQLLLSRAGININWRSHRRSTSTGITALISASQKGHAEIVQLLLSYKEGIIPKEQVREALICASKRGQEAIVKLLLSRQELDLKLVGVEAITAAAKAGHDAIIGLLISYPEVDLSTLSGDILVQSCQGSHVHRVQLLLSRPDININAAVDTGGPSNTKVTALIAACNRGHVSIVQMLLSRKDIDVNAEWSGCTALIAACEMGHESIVQLLLSCKDIDVNAGPSHYTAFFLACRYGHKSTVQKLLSRSDIKIGAAPLIVACEQGHEPIVQLLLSRSDVNINAEFNNSTALVAACNSGHEGISQLLLSRDDIDFRVKAQGSRVLVKLCSLKHGTQTVAWHLLLAKFPLDIDISAEQKDCIPLTEASRNGHEILVRFLVARREVNVNLQDRYGETALIAACRNGRKAIMQFLLSRPETAINIQDKYGETALMAACRNSQEEIVILLLSHPEIDVTVQDEARETALSRAYKTSNKAIRKAMLSRTTLLSMGGNHSQG